MRSELVQHAQVNAFRFKRTLGARIHCIPPTCSLHTAHVFTAHSYMYYYFIVSSLIDFSILSRELTKGNPSISQVANKEGGGFVFD